MTSSTTIAIIGRPNVGKSTLFNTLTKTRDALVADMPGVTRDRQYGQGQINDHAFVVIDTGGLIDQQQDKVDQLINQQVQYAIDEADYVLFLVDGQVGLTHSDEIIVSQLRRQLSKPIILVVNKVDRLSAEMIKSEFFALGFGEPHAISARVITTFVDSRVKSIR